MPDYNSYVRKLWIGERAVFLIASRLYSRSKSAQEFW